MILNLTNFQYLLSLIPTDVKEFDRIALLLAGEIY